jgi:hypothetical protein
MLLPASNPANSKGFDIVIAPLSACRLLSGGGVCNTENSIIGSDGIVRYFLGTSEDLHMEATEQLLCESEQELSSSFFTVSISLGSPIAVASAQLTTGNSMQSILTSTAPFYLLRLLELNFDVSSNLSIESPAGVIISQDFKVFSVSAAFKIICLSSSEARSFSLDVSLNSNKLAMMLQSDLLAHFPSFNQLSVAIKDVTYRGASLPIPTPSAAPSSTSQPSMSATATSSMEPSASATTSASSTALPSSCLRELSTSVVCSSSTVNGKSFSQAFPRSVIFNANGEYQFLTLPICQSFVWVHLFGAGGYAATCGGDGAYVTGILPVVGGETLRIIAGRGGQPNAQSVMDASGGGGSGVAGGGGRSACQRQSANGIWSDIVSAGGGGGGQGSACAGSANWNGAATGVNDYIGTDAWSCWGAGASTSRPGDSSCAGFPEVAAGAGFGGSCPLGSGGGGGMYGGGSACGGGVAGGGTSLISELLCASGIASVKWGNAGFYPSGKFETNLHPFYDLISASNTGSCPIVRSSLNCGSGGNGGVIIYY